MKLKKLLALLLVGTLLLSMTACKNEKADKYCSNCGNGVSKSASFCDECGAELNKVEEPMSSITDTTSTTDSATTTKSTQKVTMGVTEKTTTTRCPRVAFGNNINT